MKDITKDTLRSMIKEIDQENTSNMETFIELLTNKFDAFFDSDIDDITEYLFEEMGIESDSDVYNMSLGEVNHLLLYINQMIEFM